MPLLSNTLRLFSKGFGGFFPLAFGLVTAKQMQKSVLYQSDVDGQDRHPD